jgi:hypothetical protein
MFKFRKETKPDQLQELIDKHTAELLNNYHDDEEYAHRVDQLSKLCKLQETQSPKFRVSPDTLALIGANLLGIVIVVAYEHAHVITSKAFSSIIKPK